jgi:hypothetical protein
MGLPRIKEPVTFLWVQLSKSHVLRGEMAMRRYWVAQPPEKGEVRNLALLRQATKDYTLALAYGELFADDYRDIRRAKDTIYAQFQGANLEEFRAIYQAVKDTAVQYDLEYSPARPRVRARPRMRNFLEENFGTLDELEKGLTWVQP